MGKIERMRLFFAVWPDDSLRKALQNIIQELGASHRARWVAPEKLHMTLAFLGDVGVDRLERLAHVGADLNQPCGSFTLDRLEWWSRPGVLCLVPTSRPEALLALVDRLSLRLREEGFALEDRAFRPHLTLARRAKYLPAFDLGKHGPLAWKPRSLTLVQSTQDEGRSRYQILESWSLPESPIPKLERNSDE